MGIQYIVASFVFVHEIIAHPVCAYKIKLCKDCDFVYVGQTKRDLNSRLKEHQRAIKQQKPENSALCEHVILFDHVIDWAHSRILKTESNFSKRLTAESWFILSRPKVINRSDGESFSIVYRSLL